MALDNTEPAGSQAGGLLSIVLMQKKPIIYRLWSLSNFFILLLQALLNLVKVLGKQAQNLFVVFGGLVLESPALQDFHTAE